jgi:hypothetical protein
MHHEWYCSMSRSLVSSTILAAVAVLLAIATAEAGPLSPINVYGNLGTKERNGGSGTWTSEIPSLSIGINAVAVPEPSTYARAAKALNHAFEVVQLPH